MGVLGPCKLDCQACCRDMEQMAKDMEDAVAKAATDLVKEFEDKWKPLMQNLEEAEDTFEDLSGVPATPPAHLQPILHMVPACFHAATDTHGTPEKAIIYVTRNKSLAMRMPTWVHACTRLSTAAHA